MREKLFRATTIIAVASLGSKLLGFLREMALARFFGASMETDAYLVAFTVPGVLFAAIGASLTTVLIPVYNEYVNTVGEKEAQRLANTVVNAMLVLLMVLLVMGLTLTPQLVRVLAPGFDADQTALTVRLSRLMLPVIVFMGLSFWATAILQARQHFTAPALIGIPYNIVLITGFVLGGLYWGITGAAVATLIAVLGQFLVQVPALKLESFQYRPVLDWHHPGLQQLGTLIVPVIIGSGAGTINLAVDRILASGLDEGSISALNYANKIYQLPYGLIGLAIITVLYPTVSEFAARGDLARVSNSLTQGLQLLAFVMIPATVGLLILRAPIIRVAFERGAFDAQDTQLTTYALLFYSLGLLWIAWRVLLNRTFYALQDTWTPMVIGVVAVVVNIVANLLLVGPLAHGGLALGTVLSAVVTVILLYWRLKRVIPTWKLSRLVQPMLKIIAASAIMAVVVWFVHGALWGGPTLARPLANPVGTGALYDLVGLLVSAGVGMAIYLVASWLLGVEMLDELLAMLRGVARRVRGRLAGGEGRG